MTDEFILLITDYSYKIEVIKNLDYDTMCID
jgi:hypothetical protein